MHPVVVLNDDQGVAGLIQDGRELEDGEDSADLRVLEPASRLRIGARHFGLKGRAIS